MEVKTKTATEAQIEQLRLHAVNDVTREIATRGIALTWEQVDELGDETIDWMVCRLSLAKYTDDAGITLTPARYGGK